MSRIGNLELTVLEGVNVTVEGSTVTVKGPKGELTRKFDTRLEIKNEDSKITVHRPNDTKELKSIHGTTTALINNMINGTKEGFKKELEINGVGYRANLQGKTLVVNAGYSHLVEKQIPEGIEVEVPKNTEVIISGIDKQLVGEFAAQIRKIRPPEPYKGKGIRYKDEYVRRKEGKKA